MPAGGARAGHRLELHLRVRRRSRRHGLARRTPTRRFALLRGAPRDGLPPRGPAAGPGCGAHPPARRGAPRRPGTRRRDAPPAPRVGGTVLAHGPADRRRRGRRLARGERGGLPAPLHRAGDRALRGPGRAGRRGHPQRPALPAGARAEGDHRATGRHRWSHRAPQPPLLWERLRDEVARADRYGQPLSLLMLDLDDFKLVNDRFGHPVGDELLRAVGRALQTQIRQGSIAPRATAARSSP